MEFPFPETGHEKFHTKKKGKLLSKSKPKNSFGRRAHHNALEQQRRGIIRGCFESLRKSVPSLASEDKKLSRSGILRETAKYIKLSKERIAQHIDDLEELRLQNQLLSGEVDCLGYLHETTPLCEDFNTFTKTLIEGEEITSSPPTSNNIPEKFSNCTPDHLIPDRDIVIMEQDLLESSESVAREMSCRQISSAEEFGIDARGFAQSPLSIYSSSCSFDVWFVASQREKQVILSQEEEKEILSIMTFEICRSAECGVVVDVKTGSVTMIPVFVCKRRVFIN